LAGPTRRLVINPLRIASKGVFAAVDRLLGPYPGPRILIYHQIDAGLGRQMEVTKESFNSHIAWLLEHKTVVDLDTAIARRGEVGAHRLVVLTFDDGYDDFYRLGFPLLKAHNLPFVLYLTTEPIETGKPLGPPQALPLTWDQVGEMASSGLMTTGAHTHRHPDLRFLDAAEALDELSISDDLIRRRVGQAPRHFAYPFGYWSPSADSAVRARYGSAALGGGAPVTAATDPLALHRLPIQLSDGVFFFRRKLQTGLRLEESVRRQVTRYRGP
jgi:peptidoglycan/xylan/chitin deacetylase (PgdA/CDA1 family)